MGSGEVLTWRRPSHPRPHSTWGTVPLPQGGRLSPRDIVQERVQTLENFHPQIQGPAQAPWHPGSSPRSRDLGHADGPADPLEYSTHLPMVLELRGPGTVLLLSGRWRRGVRAPGCPYAAGSLLHCKWHRWASPSHTAQAGRCGRASRNSEHLPYKSACRLSALSGTPGPPLRSAWPPGSTTENTGDPRPSPASALTGGHHCSPHPRSLFVAGDSVLQDQRGQRLEVQTSGPPGRLIPWA